LASQVPQELVVLSSMRTFLLVLAFLAHHAHARGVQKSIDAQEGSDRASALAALLLAVNPSLGQSISKAPSRARGAHHTTGHQDVIDDSSRVVRSAAPPNAIPVGVVSNAELLRMRGGSNVPSDETWDSLQLVRVQGGELETWSFTDTERLLVAMNSNDESLTNWKHEGRLMNVAIDLNRGPDNTPYKLRIKSGKGVFRGFKGIIETPGRHSSLFIKNIGELEFPISAGVAAQKPEDPEVLVPTNIYEMTDPYLLQGSGTVKTYPLSNEVDKVKVHFTTNGRPLYGKIELLMGPNSVRYEMDVYSEDGKEWPFFTILDTPGQGNSIRVVNTASWEFPLKVDVQPL